MKTIRRRFSLALMIVLEIVFLGQLAAGEDRVILKAVADTGLSSIEVEADLSGGGAPAVPIRQNQNWSGFEKKVLLLSFDTAPIQGWTVKRADLLLTLATHDLYAVGACTVLSPWQPGTSMYWTSEEGASSWKYRKNPAAGQTVSQENFWAGPETTLASVAWANPSARYSHAGPGGLIRRQTEHGIQLRIPLDPEVVQMLSAGVAFGLAITDDKGQVAEAYSLKGTGYPYRYNAAEDIWVYTSDIHDENLRPQLEVTGEPTDRNPPAAITDLSVSSTDSVTGEVILGFRAPADGEFDRVLAYEVVSTRGGLTERSWDKASPIPAWAIPRPSEPGAGESLTLFTLEPGEYEVGIRAVDFAGNRSPAAITRVRVPQRRYRTLPIPKVTSGLSGGSPVQVEDKMVISAIPEMAKLDPVSGLLLLDGDAYQKNDNYLLHNEIWDSSSKRIKLQGMRNEVLAFKLIVSLPSGMQQLSNIRLRATDLAGPSGKIAVDPNLRAFRLWYVKTASSNRPVVGPNAELIEDVRLRPSAWHSEVCLPLTDRLPSFDIPSRDNKVEGQRYQAVWFDLYLPPDMPPGAYQGGILIEAEEVRRPAEIRLEVEVLPFRLPDKNRFSVEVNRYNSPLQWLGINTESEELVRGMPTPERNANRELLHDFYRMAHQHRTVLTALPYSQSGSLSYDFVPEMSGEGTNRRVKSWSEFDFWMGPLLDGSAFSPEKGYIGPGINTPVDHVFLPFFEAWPMPLDVSTYRDFSPLKTRLEFAEWAKQSRRLEQAFTPEYREGWIEVAEQFFRHFREKGYVGTQYQFFYNNKYYFKVNFFSERSASGTSFWLLDEPVDFDDFDANRFFHELARAATEASAGDLKVGFRVDVSQPEMVRDLWNGLVDIWMVGGARHAAATLQLRRRLISGENYWSYGGGPSPSAPHINLQQSFLWLWAKGDTGNMPYWNTFGGTGSAWENGDALAVFYRGPDYPGGSDFFPGPLAGTRLKVIRRAEQDIEYLHLLAESRGWSRKEVQEALRSYADDPTAALLTFEKLTLQQLFQLRQAVIDLLQEQ